MPSDHRRKELVGLLGNCVIAITLLEKGPKLVFAQQAAEKHIAELNRDYPGWENELQR